MSWHALVRYDSLCLLGGRAPSSNEFWENQVRMRHEAALQQTTAANNFYVVYMFNCSGKSAAVRLLSPQNVLPLGCFLLDNESLQCSGILL
jgi:hypothetical protein